ncbi:putative leucine-rich repeat-containing protein DDB_G0290503 [Patiria miniata]|uniref:Ubiquitin-like domain-containing protein n=1 Tax=Patiria miniata TaxID=46514 RepID=A0A914B0Y5_PATMI|nr:putative leucine-rich repeat-containing protein DDB_G0290503 [Patiria miniata]
MDRATRRKLLESKKEELSEAIDAEKVARELLARDGISEDIRDLILKQRSNKDKTSKLVDVMKIAKNSKYEMFCEVLREHGHDKLAQQLMKQEERSTAKRKTKTGAGEAKRKSSSTKADSYADVFKSCRNCFISDVAADPNRLVQQLETGAGKGVALSSATKRQVELEAEAEAKAEILFEAILPQINEYGPFFEMVQILREPYQHLSNQLWEQLKNIVVPPPKSGANVNRNKQSAGSSHSSLPASPGSLRSAPQSAGKGPSNDIMKSLTNLQSDLTESQSDSLKQSLQLERCIQTTAEANNSIKKLKVQLRLSEEERDAAASQADAARQQAAEARQLLETGLAEADAERKKLEDQHRKWEGQIRRRMSILEQKETYLASKEVELRRREEEQKQRNQLQRRQHESLEKKGLDMSNRGERQDMRSAEYHVRQDRMKERENNLEMNESQLSEREEEVARKESILKKKDIDLRRKEIETIRLEEQIKMMQASQRKMATQLKQKEQSVAQAEEDVKIIGDNLQQREESLREKERRLNMKMLQVKETEEDLEQLKSRVEKKERQVQEAEAEMREWEAELENKSQELSNMTSGAEIKEEELRQKEEEVNFKKKELDSLQDVLDCRLQAQERMERALRMIEVEQIRRDKEILNREAEYFHFNFPSQKKLEEMAGRMEELDKKDGELKKREELLSWIEVEQQRREVELKKQQLLAERARREAEAVDDEEAVGDNDDQRTEVDSVPLSDAISLPLEADPEPEMFGYEVMLKGARYAKRGSKSSFEMKVAGIQTVAAFKNILETEEGVPATWQSVYLNGQHLDDSMTLPSSGTPGGLQKIELKLNTPQLKERDIIKLKVRSCNGPTHTIEFSQDDTVALAKARIYKYTAIPPHQQLLSYKEVLLENHAPLQLYSIRKNATMDLRLRFSVIAEMSSSQQMTITADEINTIANIKANIFEKTKLPLDNLKISYRGKQLEDHRTLAHYNIEEGAVLHVSCALNVKMHATNTDINLDVEPGATVQQLKQILSRRKNINADRMYIVTGDQILNDDQDVTEVVRHGKDLGMHVGNVLVMSSSGQIMRNGGDNEGQQTGNQTDRSLDLSVSGSLNLSQIAR